MNNHEQSKNITLTYSIGAMTFKVSIPELFLVLMKLAGKEFTRRKVLDINKSKTKETLNLLNFSKALRL